MERTSSASQVCKAIQQQRAKHYYLYSAARGKSFDDHTSHFTCPYYTRYCSWKIVGSYQVKELLQRYSTRIASIYCYYWLERVVLYPAK